MSGTKSRLTSLALRKQLLLAESEVNRVHLANDCRRLVEESQVIVDRVHSIYSSVMSVVSIGVAGFKAAKDMRAASGNGKASWISKVFNGVRVGAALWKSFRQ